MPAELELVGQVEETEKTKSEAETTKDICTKMVKAESEHTENNAENGRVESVPNIVEAQSESVEVIPSEVKGHTQNNQKNGSDQHVPDIVEIPQEPKDILPVSPEPEPIPEVNSQPDIVLESESPQPSVQEPEVCQLPRIVSEPEPVSEVYSNGHSFQEVPAEPEEASAKPAPVVQSMEPKAAPEVRSETVRNLVQQSELDAAKAPVMQNGTPKKVQMMTSLDENAVRSAYEDVRADNTDTQWAVFKFQGSCIVRSAIGSEFEKFRAQFTENERAFGFIRVQVGDELSKRQKFVFITWVGPAVSVIQRAKMSTDKALMKHIISNFAVELQPETLAEINLDHFKTELNKAGGANYGTGVRDS